MMDRKLLAFSDPIIQTKDVIDASERHLARLWAANEITEILIARSQVSLSVSQELLVRMERLETLLD
jgi:hypothetical protein